MDSTDTTDMVVTVAAEVAVWQEVAVPVAGEVAVADINAPHEPPFFYSTNFFLAVSIWNGFEDTTLLISNLNVKKLRLFYNLTK